MQGIPTIDTFPVNSFEFLIAIAILTILMLIIGYRKDSTNLRYWVISIIKITVVAVSWLFLALMTNAAVFTHISLPVEVKPTIVDILNIMSYLGFCILLIFIEMHRGVPKTDSETTVVISE